MHRQMAESHLMNPATFIVLFFCPKLKRQKQYICVTFANYLKIAFQKGRWSR